MNQWKIKIHNELKFKNQIKRNKIIMDYTLEYSSINKTNKIKAIWIINLVWLYKKLYLPVELVGIRGNYQTQAYNDIKAKSIIKWKF